MKLIIAATLLILSCAQVSQAETLEGVKPVLRFKKDSFKNYFIHDHHLTVDVQSYSFPRGPQRAKFEKALEIMEEVVNSSDFKNMVIGFINSEGLSKYQKNYLWNQADKPLTNEEIYKVIMNADEHMLPNTENTMNLNSYVKICKWYERLSPWCSGVVGSTMPSSSKWIKLNWKYYSYFDVPDMVANIVHEWIHLLGFTHGEANIREEVPYVVGSIAGEVAKNILAGQKLILH